MNTDHDFALIVDYPEYSATNALAYSFPLSVMTNFCKNDNSGPYYKYIYDCYNHHDDHKNDLEHHSRNIMEQHALKIVKKC
jgi:hypothetical protein